MQCQLRVRPKYDLALRDTRTRRPPDDLESERLHIKEAHTDTPTAEALHWSFHSYSDTDITCSCAARVKQGLSPEPTEALSHAPVLPLAANVATAVSYIDTRLKPAPNTQIHPVTGPICRARRLWQRLWLKLPRSVCCRTDGPNELSPWSWQTGLFKQEGRRTTRKRTRPPALSDRYLPFPWTLSG